jgi:hypothetical protein
LTSEPTGYGPSFSSGVMAAVLSQGPTSAGVPAALALSATQAANGLTAGQATTAVTSAKVAALTEGLLKTMLLSKLKLGIGAVMLVVFAAVAVAASALSSPPLRAEPPAVKKEQRQEPKPFAVAGRVCSLAWGREEPMTAYAPSRGSAGVSLRNGLLLAGRSIERLAGQQLDNALAAPVTSTAGCRTDARYCTC